MRRKKKEPQKSILKYVLTSAAAVSSIAFVAPAAQAQGSDVINSGNLD